MTRILIQRGSGGSSSGQNRSSTPGPSSGSAAPPHIPSTSKEEDPQEAHDVRPLDDFVEFPRHCEDKPTQKDEGSDSYRLTSDSVDNETVAGMDTGVVQKELGGVSVSERHDLDETNTARVGSSHSVMPSSFPPPPPPAPPPRPSASNLGSRKINPCGSVRNCSSRRMLCRAAISTSSGSRPSSPRSFGDAEGYNSADEQAPCFGSFDDAEKERQFELEIRAVKGLEVKRMTEDGNCLFRAVADQVYGDPESYDLIRQLCIDYMERERDHFSQFITEGFTSYCKRKRKDKVYGNNLEIQALSEMYNRPIHIYSYSTEPINIFHGSYSTDMPPIRLSYHHGNHYNSLVDPRRLNIGAGLGFSSLRGSNVDKDQIKAAIRAQQDQQIDNALLAEGRFYSDLELTEKEIERMVMEVSRAEFFADNKFKQHTMSTESSSGAEPSSSGATTGPSRSRSQQLEGTFSVSNFNRSMEIVLSMGFSYLQVAEAYSIFGDDVDSIICYLLETGGNGYLGSLNQWKGKATE